MADITKSIYVSEKTHRALKKEALTSNMDMRTCLEIIISEYLKWIKRAALAEAREQQDLERIDRLNQEIKEAQLSLDEAVLEQKKKLLRRDRWK